MIQKKVINLDDLSFYTNKILFIDKNIENIFKNKNNKSVRETIVHKRYSKHKDYVIKNYYDYLDTPLGEYLYSLKLKGDNFYKLFLNKFGDEKFCHFNVQSEHIDKKGLYIFIVNDEIKYIGRCRDSFHKRFNTGYGKITPKNCYLDGQSTNTRINHLINKSNVPVYVYVCPLDDEIMIINKEKELIKKHNPLWNKQ